MKQELNPEDSPRTKAFSLWMSSPMPMVTLTKTFDVTHIYKLSKRHNLKFNMLLCWCIGKAASDNNLFYTIPEKDKLFHFDDLAINVIVNNRNGDISSCDIPFNDNIEIFNNDYTSLTRQAADTCQSTYQPDHAVIGTSAMIATKLDCIVNQYTDQFCNPMVTWGQYRKGLFKITLPVSFQFHHVQMDGGHAARFLEKLQETIKNGL